MRALARPARVALRGEPALQHGQGGRDEDVLRHAVPEGQREDPPALRVLDPERVARADVAEDLRAADDEVARGEGVELTPEQLKRWGAVLVTVTRQPPP